MPEVAQNHPDAATLADFAQGRLLEDDAAIVASHVADCAACTAAVRKVLGPVQSVFDETHEMPGNPHITVSCLKKPTMAATSSALPGPLRDQDKYQILQILGAGGMGIVYKAQHKVTGRVVALKVVQQDLLGAASAKARFLREAKALSKLDHPNIVRIHNVEQLGDLIVVVMEYLEGDSLASVVQRTPNMPVAQACRYILQAARGLEHAHEQGLVHRDIKPDNLRLGASGEVKVVDFGLVRSLQEDAASQDLTGANAMLGTPGYMAPEQAVDSANASVCADLYALGCTFFCLLTGRPPFRGKTMVETLMKHAREKPPPLSQWRKDVPAKVESLLSRLLAKDPAERPQQAAEVIAALEPFVDTDKKPGKAKAGRLQTARRKRIPKWWIAAGISAAMLFLFVGLWAAGVIRVRTPDGVIVIEASESNPEVFVDGTMVTVTWDKSGKKAEIRIKPGTRRIEVKKDGYKIYGEEVEVEQGGRRIFLARFEPVARTPDVPAVKTKPQVTPKESADNSDREAAEWVLSIGGKVIITAAGKEQEVEVGKEVPSGEFRLLEIRLTDKATDKDFIRLKGLKSLTDVKIGWTRQITGMGFEQLQTLPQLRQLYATGSHVDDQGLAYLNGTGLTCLDLCGTKITDAGLMKLKGLNKLINLDLGATSVTDEGLKCLKEIPNLELLHVHKTRITDAGLAHLNRNPKFNRIHIDVSQAKYLMSIPGVRTITLGQTHPTDADLEKLFHLTWVTSIDLRSNDSKITEAGVKKLSEKLPTCKILWDGGTLGPMSDPDRRAAEWVLSMGGKVTITMGQARQDLANKATLPGGEFRLISIDLNGKTKVVDNDLKQLSGLTNLRYLGLGETRIVGTGLLHLAGLKNLEDLVLGGTQVTDSSLEHLKGLTNLKAISLVWTPVTGRGFQHLKGLTNLTAITIPGPHLTDEGLFHLASVPNVRNLDIRCRQITDAGLFHLKRLAKLEGLLITGPNITDAGLANLKELKKLESLENYGAKITDVGLAQLPGLTRVRLPIQDVKYLHKLPKIKKLSLWESGATDADLEKLYGFTGLIGIDLRGNPLSESAVKKFAEKMPQCRIGWAGRIIEPKISVVDRVSAKENPFGDISGVNLLRPEDKLDQVSLSPPAGAIMLFDGKNLDHWLKRQGKEQVPWKVLDGGIMEVHGGDIITRQAFDGKFKLHLEFRVPYLPKISGQARGKSGVCLQGRYEIQILDSYGLKSTHMDCGGINSVAAPLANVCKAPTVWQTYDIEYTSPLCVNGKKTAAAVMTVFHNGVKIHDNVKIAPGNSVSETGGEACVPSPIMLQDHGHPVQYRNIWLIPIKK